MANHFRYYEVNQDLLLPPSLRDWLPEGHLAYFVSETVEQMDLSDFVSSYQSRTGKGAPATDPRMLLKLLIYGYCLGVRSSRKIEKATHENVAFRFLSADQHPDHDTIATFRVRHLEAIEGLFLQVLKLCQKAGLVKLGYVALDGTKIRASANKSKCRTYSQLMKSEEELKLLVAEMLRDAEEADRREDEKYGKHEKGDELPEALQTHEKRLKKIRELLQEIEAEAQDEKVRIAEETKLKKRDDAQWREETGQRFTGRYPQTPGVGVKAEIAESRRSPTDFDARILKEQSTGGYILGYNCQAVVDKQSQIIVAQDVVNQNNDKQLAPPMVEKVRANLDALPHRLAADADYFSERDVVKLEQQGVTCYMPPKEGANGKRFTEDGKTFTEAMRDRLDAGLGRAFYRLRKMLIEPVFGQIKERQDFRRFSLRSLDKAKAEWALVTLCHNLHKLHLAHG
jgi:transposase